MNHRQRTSPSTLPELDASQAAQPEWKYANRAELPGTLDGSREQNSGSISFLTCQMGDAQQKGYLVAEVDSQRIEGVDLCCTVVDQPSGGDGISGDRLDHGIDRCNGERRIAAGICSEVNRLLGCGPSSREIADDHAREGSIGQDLSGLRRVKLGCCRSGLQQPIAAVDHVAGVGLEAVMRIVDRCP